MKLLQHVANYNFTYNTALGCEWYLHQDLHLDLIHSGDAFGCYHCTIETIRTQVSPGVTLLLSSPFPVYHMTR